MTRFSGCSRFIAQISFLASFAENGSAFTISWIFKIVRCILRIGFYWIGGRCIQSK